MAPMGTADTAETSRFHHQLRTMHLSSKEKSEYGKLLLTLTLEASKNQAQWRALVLREALAHKEEWGAKFAMARKLGSKEPAVYPHPDDIIINHDLTVTFDGPILADEARQLDLILEQRDLAFSVVQEVNGRADLDVESRREMWGAIRRRYYRYSPRRPKRLKMPFPKFEPCA
ncbi:hypothetical protein AUC45_12715 [Erythrobacter sp. YT30]|nr:hypothetical protein AUC45_12715 [Erythrobacter sp. YT30]